MKKRKISQITLKSKVSNYAIALKNTVSITLLFKIGKILRGDIN